MVTMTSYCVTGGGGGGKKSQKNCVHTKWMTPSVNAFLVDGVNCIDPCKRAGAAAAAAASYGAGFVHF